MNFIILDFFYIIIVHLIDFCVNDGKVYGWG